MSDARYTVFYPFGDLLDPAPELHLTADSAMFQKVDAAGFPAHTCRMAKKAGRAGTPLPAAVSQTELCLLASKPPALLFFQPAN